MNKKQTAFSIICVVFMLHTLWWNGAASVGVTYWESLIMFSIALLITVGGIIGSIRIYYKLGD